MSENKWFKAEDAFVPAVEEYAHELGTVLARNGFFNLLGGANASGTVKKILQHAILMGTGTFQIPRKLVPFGGASGDLMHKYLNEFVDAFGIGLKQGLEAQGHITPEMAKAAADAAVKKVEHKLFTIDPVTRMAHSAATAEGCEILTNLNREMTIPGRKDKKTGEETPAKSRLVTSQLTFEAVLNGRHPLCPACNRASVEEPGKDAPKAEHKAPPRSFPELVADLQKNSPEHAKALWEFYRAQTKEVQENFRGAVNDEGRAMMLAGFPQAEWLDIASMMTGVSTKAVGVLHGLVDRAKSEQAELERTLVILEGFIEKGETAVAERRKVSAAKRVSAREARIAAGAARESKGRWERRGLALVAFIALVYVAASYLPLLTGGK